MSNGHDPWERLLIRWWRKRKAGCTHCGDVRIRRTLSLVFICLSCDRPEEYLAGIKFPQEWILEQLNAIRYEKVMGLIDKTPPDQQKDLT